MSQIRDWFFEIARQPATALWLDIAVKGTVLVLLAMLVLRMLPRSSAALRHWVWCLAFCGLIVLPGLSFCLPAWTIPILPAWREDHRPLELAPEIATASAEAAEVVGAARRPAANAFSDDDQHLLPDRRPSFFPSPAGTEQIADETAVRDIDVVTSSVLPKKALVEPPSLAFADPAILWAMGAVLAFLPLLVGVLRSAMLRAKAQNVHDIAWTTLRDQLCTRLGLKRSVRLLAVKSPIIPLSCGIVHPAVILPSDASRWNEPLRRFVLLHELAHVKRHDVVFQLIARLACVLYWFHPLVWYAMHRLRIERELACDDAVLAAGERASDYAEQLLEVARRLQPLRLHAAVAMAQSTNLEHRIGTLFSRARSHLPLSPRSSRLLLACAAIVVIAVSVVRPSAKATVDEQPNQEQQTAPRENAAEAVEKEKPTQITGRVVSHDGKPVPGASVVLVRVQFEQNRNDPKTELLSETATDSQGRFKTPYPAVPPRSSLYLFASAPEHGLAWDHRQAARAGKESVLKLAPDDAPIDGRILDLEGQPIAGVQVAVRSVTESVENIDEWIEKARQNPTERDRILAASYYAMSGSRADKMARFPAQDSLDLNDPKLSRLTVTDRDGRFRLTGLGSKRLVLLEISGAGIAKGWINAVTYPMEAVPYPQIDPRYRFTKCFGSRFDVSVEPELRITGIVRDSAARRPLAGVKVTLRSFANFIVGDEPFVSDVTDADGRYELAGIPRSGYARSGLTLRLTPAGNQPYFRTDVVAPPTAGLDPVVRDIELKRAIWIGGRVVDEQTGKPVPGEVAYYPFLTNEAAKDYANFDARITGMGDDYHYATGEDGSFRLPGLPGQGLLTFIANDDSRYPRADGADAIGGLRPKSTADRRVAYYFYSAELVNAVRQIDPPAGQDEFTYDVRLKSFVPHKVRLLDSDGQPVSGVVVEGVTRIPIRGRAFDHTPQPSSIVDIFGLAEDEPRYVRLTHRERGLAAFARLTVSDFAGDKPKEVTLLPAASIVGRIVDQEGKPVNGAHAFANLDVNGEDQSSGFMARWRHSTGNTVKADGQLLIERVPPGVKYSLQAYDSATGRGATLELGPLKPGARLDVGDITVAPRDAAADGPFLQPSGVFSANRFSAKATPAKANGESMPNKQSPNSTKNKGNDITAAPANESTGAKGQTTTVRGRVTGPDGNAAAGAHVAVIARRILVDRGAELDSDGAVLAEAKADDDGQYQLTITGASSKTHRYAHILARSEKSALAWQKLNLDAGEEEVSFELRPAKPLAGRLVDLEGQPAAGVQLSVASVRPTVTGEQFASGGIGFWRSTKLPASWPQPVKSDEQGRFIVPGIPEDHGVFLEVESSDRFAPQTIALNTGMPEQRPENDRTYRSQVVKNAKPGEEAVLPLAPAQIFTGRVTYEDTGDGAVHAPIQIWSSQQEYASMIALGGRADADGRYRINPYPGIRFGVTAYAPLNAPYLARQLEGLAWDTATGTKEVNIKLPRGVMVHGKIQDLNGRPVSGASIQYVPEEANNPNVRDDIRTGWQAIEVANHQGQFQIVVLPGPGRLLVHAPGGEFVLREFSRRELYSGQPGGKRNYRHGIARIEPAKDSGPLDVTIRLQRGGTARGELVDEKGKPIDDALMVTRLSISVFSLDWGGSPRPVLGGRFELGGLAADQEYPVHFLEPERRLGATVMLKAGSDPLRVVLKPCGEAVMRFVDEDGKPIADHHPGTRMVVTPGPLDWNRGGNESELTADEDFIVNIDRLNHDNLKTDGEGRVTLPALIPGATYRVLTVKDEKLIVAKEFQAKAGETIELGDIVYEGREQ